MALPMPQWVKRFRNRRVDPFTRASRGGLDVVQTPPYDMSEALRTELREEVDKLVARLLPNAVDAYSRHVLDDWLDARAEQLIARLDSEREERQAVGEALIGLAREEVVRRKVRYDADVAWLLQVQEALEVARQQLTGKREIGPFARVPELADARVPEPANVQPLASTLGRVDTAPDWEHGPPGREQRRPPGERAAPPNDAPITEQSTGSEPAGGVTSHTGEYIPATTRPHEENSHVPGHKN